MTLAIGLTSIIISALAMITAIAALAMVIGMKLSTHRVEWKQLEFDSYEKEEEEEKTVEEDDFLEKALSMQRKKKKKEEDPLDAIAETSNF